MDAMSPSTLRDAQRARLVASNQATTSSHPQASSSAPSSSRPEAVSSIAMEECRQLSRALAEQQARTGAALKSLEETVIALTPTPTTGLSTIIRELRIERQHYLEKNKALLAERKVDLWEKGCLSRKLHRAESALAGQRDECQRLQRELAVADKLGREKSAELSKIEAAGLRAIAQLAEETRIARADERRARQDLRLAQEAASRAGETSELVSKKHAEAVEGLRTERKKRVQAEAETEAQRSKKREARRMANQLKDKVVEQGARLDRLNGRVAAQTEQILTQREQIQRLETGQMISDIKEVYSRIRALESKDKKLVEEGVSDLVRAGSSGAAFVGICHLIDHFHIKPESLGGGVIGIGMSVTLLFGTASLIMIGLRPIQLYRNSKRKQKVKQELNKLLPPNHGG